MNKPIHVCKEQLQKKSTRDSGIFASKRKILVTLTQEKDAICFQIDRDAGRGLYAEVTGTLCRETKNTVAVSGKGRVHIATFLLFVYFFFMTLFFTVIFWAIPFLVMFLGSFAIFFIPIMIFMTFRNRNGLVNLVYDALADPRKEKSKRDAL